jgi:hypothetical protein
MEKRETKRLPLSSIKTIARGSWKMEPERVARYRRMLREGKKPPPIQVTFRLPDGRWQLFDGRHRLRAARLEHAKTIEVEFLIYYKGRPAKAFAPPRK